MAERKTRMERAGTQAPRRWTRAEYLAAALIIAAVAAVYAVFFNTDLKHTLDRHQMVRKHLTGDILPGGVPIRDPSVLAAMRSVPRHEFVLEPDLSEAYGDRPLSLEHGRTISQPYLVAFMAELLELTPSDRVLEINTGSGYEAAVLGEIVQEVYSMEPEEAYAEEARQRLSRLGYANVHIRGGGDARGGWEEHAPYDAIFVRASVTEIPAAWKEQLKIGGRMAVPVGPPDEWQSLMIVKKIEDGTYVENYFMPVVFAPLPRAEKSEE